MEQNVIITCYHFIYTSTSISFGLLEFSDFLLIIYIEQNESNWF